MLPFPAHQTWISSWGLAVVLAATLCWLLARRDALGTRIHPSHVDLVVPLSMVGGILASVVVTRALPADRVIAGAAWVAEGRIRLIPFALGALATVLLYGQVTGQSGRRLLDLVALPALVGLAVQRLGCFLAGCCWGDLAVRYEGLEGVASAAIARQLQTLPWATGDGGMWSVTYPAGSFAWRQHLTAGLIDPDAAASLAVHPTQIYEGALFLLLAAGLWRTRIGHRIPGGVALACLVGYAVVGFATEFLRADSPVVLGLLTITQLQCAALFLLGLAPWLLSRRRENPRWAYPG